MIEPTYRDLDLSFRRHPLTGDVSTFTDEDAVKSAIRNLVLIGQYEKPFQPNLYSPVNGLLFEMMTEATSIALTNGLQYLISVMEPRVDNVIVKTNPNYDENKYEVTINYRIKKIRSQQTLELKIPVQRLR